MSSIKQLIYNALFKCATPESGVIPDQFESAEAARDHFIAMVMAELFPDEAFVAPPPSPAPSPVAALSPKQAAKAEAKAAKEAEKAAAKAAKEAAKQAEKEAAKKAKEAAKKSPEQKEAEKAAAKAAKEAAKEAEKAAKKAAKEAEKAAKKAGGKKANPLIDDEPLGTSAGEALAAIAETKAALAKAQADSPASVPLPASPKPQPKGKKVKPSADANVQKIDPTWRKHLKAATGARPGSEYSKEMETALVAYLNGLTKEAFNATKAEEHVKAFLDQSTGSNAGAGEGGVTDLEAIEVEFNGNTYAVDPVSRRVYVQDGAVFKGVGYVGMAAFADMKVE